MVVIVTMYEVNSDSDDLWLWHDATNNSFIRNATGDLRLQSDSITLKNYEGTHNYLTGTESGSVDIYHNNAKKIKYIKNHTNQKQLNHRRKNAMKMKAPKIRKTRNMPKEISKFLKQLDKKTQAIKNANYDKQQRKRES